MIKTRDEIDNKYKWDLTAIYNNMDEFEKEFNICFNAIKKYEKMRENFLDNAENLYEYIKFDYEIAYYIGRLFTYSARLKDEDLSNNKNMVLYERVATLNNKIDEVTSFFVPKLLEINYEDIKKMYKEEPRLKEYDIKFKRIYRIKPHILSDEEEKLLASYSKSLESFEDIYKVFIDSELIFDNIKDENGKSIEFNEQLYSKFMESNNRKLRKDAYNSLYKSIKQYKNTFTKILSNTILANITEGKLRKYKSPIEAALFPSEIDTNIYYNLIDTINNNQEAIYEYFRLKKELLGVDKLHFYDVYVPNIKSEGKEYAFDEAKKIVLEALSILGNDYVENLNKAFDNNWIDIYPNKSKRGGAYSSGTYGTNPYILLNYKDTLNDVSTLAHELGHSMHTYYSKKNQPIQTASYTLFAAEVASTVNELLLAKYMIKNSKSREEKLSILNKLLELFKATIYRQTMFAEFELWMYEEVNNDRVLTSDSLSNKYKELLNNYFSDTVEIDDNIIYEWIRIPHFYYNFYVYQYATGLSAACQIVKNIEENGKPAIDNYKKFLSAGSSLPPIEALKIAGADMNNPETIESSVEMFKNTLKQFKKELSKR